MVLKNIAKHLAQTSTIRDETRRCNYLMIKCFMNTYKNSKFKGRKSSAELTEIVYGLYTCLKNKRNKYSQISKLILNIPRKSIVCATRSCEILWRSKSFMHSRTLFLFPSPAIQIKKKGKKKHCHFGKSLAIIDPECIYDDINQHLKKFLLRFHTFFKPFYKKKKKTFFF